MSFCDALEMQVRHLAAILVPLCALLSACPDNSPADGGANNDARAGDAAGSPDGGARDATNADADELDATNPDATAPDAEPAPDAAPGIVTVRNVTGFPNLPMEVIFHDPNGDVISSTVTTALEARETVPAGSMVTVAYTVFIGKGGQTNVFNTVTGVQPGEEYLYRSNSLERMTVIGDLEVTLPGAIKGASYYTFDYGCGENFVFEPSVPVQNTVYDLCLGVSAAVSVLASARDSSDQLLAYSFVEDVPLVPGGLAMVTLGPWRTAIEDTEVFLLNPPADVIFANVGRELIRAGAFYAVRYASADLEGTTSSTLSFPVAPFGDGLSVDVFSYHSPEGISTFTESAAGRGSPAIDLSADMLPLVRDSTVALSRSEPERPTILWTPPALTFDATLVQMRIFDNNVVWTIAVPPGASSVKIPALPDAHAAQRPAIGQTFDPGIMIIDASATAGYDAFRATAGSSLSDFGTNASRVPVGKRVRTSFYRFNTSF